MHIIPLDISDQSYVGRWENLSSPLRSLMLRAKNQELPLTLI